MADQSSFAIIRFNQRNYASGGVAAVVKDHGIAERIVTKFEANQSEECRQGSWRFFIEESDLMPGMDGRRLPNLENCDLLVRNRKHKNENVRLSPLNLLRTVTACLGFLLL